MFKKHYFVVIHTCNVVLMWFNNFLKNVSWGALHSSLHQSPLSTARRLWQAWKNAFRMESSYKDTIPLESRRYIWAKTHEIYSMSTTIEKSMAVLCLFLKRYSLMIRITLSLTLKSLYFLHIHNIYPISLC